MTSGRGERLRELVTKWRKEAQDAVPPDYAKRGLHSKYLRLDNYAAGIDGCADELEALVASLSEAPSPQSEKMRSALQRIWDARDRTDDGAVVPWVLSIVQHALRKEF